MDGSTVADPAEPTDTNDAGSDGDTSQIWGGRFAEDRFTDAYAIAHTVCFPMDILFGLTTVLCGGVLERFPTLRVAMLEAGCGFLPYYLERLDEHFEKRGDEMPITRSPSETFAEGRCVLSCEPEERSLAFVCDAVGPDKIVYASDYPHWDCEFPNSVRAISERSEIDSEVKRAILYENSQHDKGPPIWLRMQKQHSKSSARTSATRKAWASG